MRKCSRFPAAVLIWLLSVSAVTAQVRHEIQFPDLPGYLTLKCDLHMHSVFSDGTVWPTVRVDEGWRLGLDAIALTDHLEYQPHKDDLATGYDRWYDLAVGRAAERNLLFPKAAEITRDTPPGHFNAIFLKDVKPVHVPEFVDSVKQANEQGGFVFWNHQEWKGSEAGKWLDVHTQLYDNKWLHGMEVCNGPTYYPQAHRWCLEKGLTMLGNSDIHEPDLNDGDQPLRRTLTLVFAKERTLDALKEALFAGRTAVWCEGKLIGRQEYLEPLFDACVRLEPPHLRTANAVLVAVKNLCDAEIQLTRTGAVGPAELILSPRTTNLLKVSTKTPDQPLDLTYTATNFWIGPEQGLPVTLRIRGSADGETVIRESVAKRANSEGSSLAIWWVSKGRKLRSTLRHDSQNRVGCNVRETADDAVP